MSLHGHLRGMWDMVFGEGGTGDPGTLYFTAGGSASQPNFPAGGSQHQLEEKRLRQGRTVRPCPEPNRPRYSHSGT